MSTAGYPSSAHASSSYVDQGRPKSIAELAAIAQHNLWDPNKPLKHWLRTAEKARKVGQSYVDTRNFEAAFIEFARAATIVLEKLPTHQEYHVLLNADQRANLGMVSVLYFVNDCSKGWYTSRLCPRESHRIVGLLIDLYMK